ncbi:MAG: hypothetical protein CEE40_08880 [Chloroflexi bacterium B3_Chlor]|nr:MAG: hypothetical protein CEE40_08880 [Chloroflexi bacterium B3_Chlor]
MSKASFAALTIIALLAVPVAACKLPALEPTGTPPLSTPTPVPLTPASGPPTPVVIEANYTNEATGLSISYPDDWAYEEFVEEVVFASSAQIITGAELESGAAMMVRRTDLEGSLTIDDLVETTLAELSFDKIRTSDPKPRTIGGQNGIMITLEGSPEGGDVSMRGFVAAAEHNGWGHLFVAASMLDEWSEYSAVLEQMLGSVEFQCVELTYASSTLGLSMRYPEGWIFEEQGEQVIFGTSEEILTGAELETGAAMLVIGSELEDGLTFEEMVEMIVSELSSEEIVTGDRRAYGIGGQDGIMLSFEGTPEEDLRVRGFVAAVEHSKWGYLFIGFSVLDEWCEYESLLHTMLDSVEFAGQ